MQKPFFSVIIPAYNLEKYIAAALQSVLDQTFQDFEIIIVNDGSTDETVSIIQSFHDPRIHLVSQSNSGVSRARNAGMQKARGSYIAFLDGDDYWYPDHLELAADFFNIHPEILVYANRHIQDELADIPSRPPSHPGFIRRLGLRGLLFMNSSNVALSSSLASRLPPWEEKMSYGEDGLYWTRCMQQTGLIGLGGTVTSIYRQRASSAMHGESYQHVSLHALITPLLEELEGMKKPKWQFAVHYLIIRELHPRRLLSLNIEERTSLMGRIRKIMHPCLNRPFFDSYMKACSARAGMEQSLSALMDRTVFLCRWLDRLERIGRSLFFPIKTNNGMKNKYPYSARPQSEDIVYATDDNGALGTGVSIVSLMENLPPGVHADIYIITGGLSGDNIARFNSLQQDYNLHLCFINMKVYLMKFHKMMFMRRSVGLD